MPKTIYTHKNIRKTQDQYEVEVSVKNPDVKVLGLYKNGHTKSLHECLKCGLSWMALPHNIIRGQSCPGCKVSPKRKTQEQYVAELADINPTIVTLGQYTGINTKLKHRCIVCDNTWDVIPKSILSNVGCPKCYNIRRNNSTRKTTEYYKNEIKHKKIQLKVLGGYKTALTKISHECLICNHIWSIRPNDILSGNQGCPECANKITSSKGEKEVAAFIKEIYKGLVIENDRTILNPKELDVYLPEIGFAVEYNGDYWHSKKPKGYHTDKTTRCAEQGIKLLHIWESDWKAGVELCKHKIQDALIFNVKFQS